MKKMNFKKPFVDCFGNPVEEVKDGQKVQVEISHSLAKSLFNLVTLSNTPLTPEEKLTAYKISKQMAEHPEEVELTTEDASFLKRVAGQLMSAGAYGQIYDIIEEN